MSQEHSTGLFWRSWTIPKDGSRPDQNEDAWRAEFLRGKDGAAVWLIALADGATEAVYSGLWAQTLVSASEPSWPTLSDDDLNARLDQARRSFSPISSGEQIPWYVRNKFLTQGSQATLLVVTVERVLGSDDLSIRAVSVGDCCILLFKPNGDICSFPMHSSEDFGVHPSLVGNHPPKASLNYDRWQAQCQPGDLILACTDAVSKWVLQCVESNLTGLLFDALRGLLGPVTSGPSQSVDEPIKDSLLSNAERIVAENNLTERNSIENSYEPRSVLRLLKHQIQLVCPWWSPERSETTSLTEHQSAEPGLTTAHPDPADSVDVAWENIEPVMPETNSDSRSKFEQFIDSCRAPESRLRMRNDDATLVVCVPISSADADQQLLDVLDILRRYSAAAGHKASHGGYDEKEDQTR